MPVMSAAASSGKSPSPTLAALGRIRAQRLLRLDDGADGGRRLLRLPLYEVIRGPEARERAVAHLRRVVAPPHVHVDLADAQRNRGGASHGVGPEAVDLTRLQATRGIDAERHVPGLGARQVHDAHVTLRIQPARPQQRLEHQIGPFRRGKPHALQRVEITALRIQVRPHRQEPRRPLGQRHQQLGPAPGRKLTQQVVHRPRDHGIRRPLPERPRGADLRDQLDLHVRALFAVETQLLCGQGRETGVADKVYGGDAHISGSFLSELVLRHTPPAFMYVISEKRVLHRQAGVTRRSSLHPGTSRHKQVRRP